MYVADKHVTFPQPPGAPARINDVSDGIAHLLPELICCWRRSWAFYSLPESCVRADSTVNKILIGFCDALDSTKCERAAGGAKPNKFAPSINSHPKMMVPRAGLFRLLPLGLSI
jgi:hypothetical protein